MDICTEQIITSSLQIKAREIYNTKNTDGLILHKLKKYEEKCNRYGYILKGSTNLIERSMGKNVNIDGVSLIEYNVTYQFKSILPTKNEEYKCIVESKTKMGLLCYIDYSDNISTSPLLIIVPKEYCDLEKIKVGEKIIIKAVDFRIKYMASQINLIGKIED